MNWRQTVNEKEKYAAYLASREWALLKEAVHRRAGGLCERCRVNPIDAVHHLTYRRKYREEMADLQGICNGCHSYIHAKTGLDPAVVSYDAVLVAVVDLGTVTDLAQRNFVWVNADEHRVAMVWQLFLSDEPCGFAADGVAMSLDPGTKLRSRLESWWDRQLEDGEELDLRGCVGRPARVTVTRPDLRTADDALVVRGVLPARPLFLPEKTVPVFSWTFTHNPVPFEPPDWLPLLNGRPVTDYQAQSNEARAIAQEAAV